MSDAAKISEMARDLRVNSSQPGFYHALAAQIVNDRATIAARDQTIATQAAQIEALKGAIQKIADLASPGQEINIHQAVDILTDIWTLAQCPSSAALSNTGRGA